MKKLKEFCSGLLSKLEHDLFLLRADLPEAWDWSRASLETSANHLEQLRAYILHNPFKRRMEEVFFFRHVKPVFFSKVIFFSEVWNIESGKPLNPQSQENLLTYFLTHYMQIEEFLAASSFLYNYFRDNEEYMDHKLFVRRPADRFRCRNIPLKIQPVLYYGDPEFSTGYDYLFARFRACEYLKAHLGTEMEKARLTPITDSAVGRTSGFDPFDEVISLFEKVNRPVYPDSETPLDHSDICIALQKCRIYPPPPAHEYILPDLEQKTEHLPNKLKQVIIALNNRWKQEAGDVEYDGE